MEYEPYGDEWRAELMKLSKGELISFLRKTIIEKHHAKLNVLCSLNSCAYPTVESCVDCRYLTNNKKADEQQHDTTS